MKRLSKFILIGLLFAAYPGEIANQLIVHKTVWGFISTMIYYVVLLDIGYFINKLFKRKLVPTLLYFILFGIIGLLIEYFILGQGPEAYASGMFTFWAFLFTLPRIFTDDPGQFEDWKKRILKYWLISSTIVLAVFLIPPLDVGMYLGIHVLMVQLAGFYIFFFSYLKRLYYLLRQEKELAAPP